MRIPLTLLPGVVSDETPNSVPGNYADAQNIRFRYGRPETIGAWEEFTDDVLSGVCRSALAWTDNLGVQNIAFGTNTHLYVIKAGSLYDITPVGLDVGAIDTEFFDGGYGSGGYGMGGYGVGQNEDTARTWSLACYGESLMASPAGGTIYWWQNDPMVPAGALSGAPGSVNRMTVASTRQVIAFGCEQELGGIYNPMCIRASDIEDPTDWTTGSGDNVSEDILEGGGLIIDGRPFGDDLIVLTDDALFLGTFVGSAGQAWRYDRIAVNCGLASPQAAVVVNQSAYWLTPDFQFSSYQYGGAPVPIPCPIRRDFVDNLVSEQVAKIIAVSVGEFGEVWWLYPDIRDAGLDNILTHPDDFADAAWTKTGLSVVDDNAVDPEGGNTAATVTITNGAHTLEQFVTVVPGTKYTFSWYAKRGSAGALSWGVYDVTNGADIIGPTSYYAETSASWTRISKTFTTPLGCTQVLPSPVKYGGATGTVFLWSAKLEEGGLDAADNSRHLILNTSDNSWSRGNVARTAMIDGGPITYPLAVDFAGQSYLHEKGDAAVDWFAETALQYIGEGENHVMLRSIWPDFEAQAGDIDLTIKTRAYPQSVERVKGPYVLAPGREKKDLRVEGRMVAIRLSGDAFMRLGKPSFDAVQTGGR